MLDFEARKRLMCLIIVLLFAVGWPIMSSTYLLFHPSNGTGDNNLSFGFNLITELLGLILLRVALKSQRRNFKELGWTFKFTDIGHALLLYLCFYVLEIVLILFVPHLRSEPENIGFLKSDITLFYFLFIILNPFFEE
ncbi:hypothetical protein, partial [Paenibacillus anseongense]|uniref:hypothetical protein n=1 Tax=Paenibacillus anseongense TaxID=2682845 RepID=UPI002DB563DD